jgi:hypothetical protein
MLAAVTAIDRTYNHARHDRSRAGGFYESFFQRANHPTRPLAFWIRYTVFSPKDRPQDAIGELWAIVFDGERGTHVVAKSELPVAEADFARDRFAVRIGTATVGPGALAGSAASGGHRIGWTLSFDGAGPPLFSMDRDLYEGGFPKAKSLVGLPLARYRGWLDVDGTRIGVEDWIGSQNHNWGPAHTDQYAYGQVAGFDNARESFLEVATGRLKVGPMWTPYMTPVVLRHAGVEYAFNTVPQALLRAHGRYRYFEWTFRSRRKGVAIEGRIGAPREAFVGLRYYNPPGGEKYCLNSKIASCEVTLSRPGRGPERLHTAHRCAFEILTDDRSHGVDIRT